ncbi:MAG: TyeA family type III secretion system gatekeeper subunit [Endozoicomonadaceae bacterium]|nr:TyeA family type III secretion system gatekeeper subunit [Endozoicomonadaceae bacterium]
MSGKAEFKKGVLIEETLRLLSLRWVAATDIEKLPQKMGITQSKLLPVKIIILNQLLELYRKVPDRYFKEEDHRSNLLEAVQEALDDLIAEEEEAYEEGDVEDEDADDSDLDDDDLDFDF